MALPLCPGGGIGRHATL